MKSLKITASIVALLSASYLSASASDLLSLKDVPATLSQVNWTGAYASVGAGGVFTNANSSGTGVSGGTTIVTGGDAALSGFLGDLRLGYDASYGGGLIGIWGDVSYERDKGSSNSIPLAGLTGTTAEAHLGYSAGLRIGRTFGTGLIYALAGYQGQHVTDKALNFSTDLHGGIAGIGIEQEIAPHVFFGTEVDYVAYGDWHPVQGITISADEVRATARLGYRF